MKPINNFETVQATTGEFKKPIPNGYVCKITLADDYPFDASTGKGDYLKIEYDIAEGEFENYYSKQYDRFGGDFWAATMFRSYKEKALGMFKHFTNCIESSNAGYTWNWDEKSLVGKRVGLVLGEEEYEKNDGTVGVRLYVKDVKTVQEIRDGEFKVPELKVLKNRPSAPVSSFTEVATDDDLPF
jgi:hypothetical protein